MEESREDEEGVELGEAVKGGEWHHMHGMEKAKVLEARPPDKIPEEALNIHEDYDDDQEIPRKAPALAHRQKKGEVRT